MESHICVSPVILLYFVGSLASDVVFAGSVSLSLLTNTLVALSMRGSKRDVYLR